MYTKLYSTILDSSIWSASDSTRIVWITMLAMATKNGIVHASVDGLARRANVSLDECLAALKVLVEPDVHDKSGVHGGRRVIPMQGCWELVNFEFYREAKSIDAVRKQQWRTKKVDVLDKDPSSSSSSSSSSDQQAKSLLADRDEAAAPKPKTRKARSTVMPEGFAPDSGHVSLASELGVDLSREFPKFVEHHGAKGSTFVSWPLALRTWLRNAQAWSTQGRGRQGPAFGIGGGDPRMQAQLARVARLQKEESERAKK